MADELSDVIEAIIDERISDAIGRIGRNNNEVLQSVLIDIFHSLEEISSTLKKMYSNLL
jgi:hypothetical protein